MAERPVEQPQADPAPSTGSRRRLRRRHAMVRWLVAGVGAAALARLGTQSASATNGDPVLAGQTVDATAPTRVRNGVSYTPDTTADAIQGYAAGANNSGLFGRNNDTGGIGVSGAAASGTGVFGESANGFGVGGRSSSGAGVRGESTASYGVIGQSSGYHGVYGNATSSTTTYAGVLATSNGYGVLGITPAPGYAALFAGNAFVTGTLSIGGSKSAVVPHADGTLRRLYCVESPESYFEDHGRAQLANGRVTVQIPSDFAEVVRTDSYFVYLTPLGDCRGLYVASQSASSFEVRELQVGTASIPFYFRIVAYRKDVTAPRLEKVVPLPRISFQAPDGTSVIVPNLTPPSATAQPTATTQPTATATPAPSTSTPGLPTSTSTSIPTPTASPLAGSPQAT